MGYFILLMQKILTNKGGSEKGIVSNGKLSLSLNSALPLISYQMS